MRKLTSGTADFKKIRLDNATYVDKTEYCWSLIRDVSNSQYFLSRPRRFGKSLTISTLKAIFQGKKELFQGLAIYDKPYDWKMYPVIHLDNGNCNVSSVDELKSYLHAILNDIAISYGLKLRGENLSTNFQFLIEDLAREAPVVILVDEYDKPILNNITRSDSMDFLNILRGFYSTIKTCESKIRFTFVTGVTKFYHVSLFSDLNNLTDITMNADYATMLGYTQEEFEANFAEWIADTEKKQDLPHDKFLAKIKEWYDGYKFHIRAESVYNPVSLANFFINHGDFNNYWFSTGTPTFLLDLIKQEEMDLRNVLSESVTMFSFGSFEIDSVPPVMLLLQTGYLTIKSSSIEFGQTQYQLDFPNREVSESFNVYLLNAYSKTSQDGVAGFCRHLSRAVVNGDLPKFQKTMEVFFAGIPYDVHRKSEANFQNIFYAIFKLLGYNIHAESQTNDGRIDAVLETDKYIYLFEFKLNKDDSALSQIREKEYFKPYLLSSKKITLVGANFSTDTGKISDWQDVVVTQ